MSAPTPLRRELLFAFGLLFAGAVLVAGVGVAVLLPVLTSPTQVLLFVITLLAADLAVLFAFGGTLLRDRLVEPMEKLAGDAQRIAAGDYDHRIAQGDSLELDEIRVSVNAMADRLTADQAQLAENIESLEATNLELVEARDQVIHAARLASVGTLAAGIAHEVGNPLGAIMGFVDVARKRMTAGDADPELLGAIREEADRIDRIVRGLLDYARPRKEKAGPVPPAEVVRSVCELLERQGKLDHVEARWSVPDDVPRVVMEAHRLEQVLVNLVLNALHAMRGCDAPVLSVSLSVEGGDVMRLPRRRADDPPGIDYMHRRRVSRDDAGKGIDPLFTARHVVVLEVRDSGPGIPEDDWEAVFDPFFTTKEVGEGTGLGLSICARLVEGMGGRIGVSDAEEGGARFTIRLPGYRDDLGEPLPEEGSDA